MSPEKSSSFASFCVLVPMFNEQNGAEACVRRISEILVKIPYRSALVTVNDGVVTILLAS